MEKLAFNLKEFISAFVVLFAIIDITGSIPVILNLKSKGAYYNPTKTTILSLLTMIGFLLAGEVILKLFNVDVQSFAVAGSLIIFVLAIEMIFGVEIFKLESEFKNTTIIPLVFPLIAGAGTFTSLLSLRAEYNVLNIILALIFNMIVVFFVLRFITKIENILGKGGTYILRKFFGVILLAISVKLFTSNVAIIIGEAFKGVIK
ncbi:MarC family protein [Parabacteroides sp. FAFU027]|uniref:MarC family protein n=1 Tax=Parabacteroides sp. FAFU027 TaxID=2922715 RepID=UPI001FAFC1E3|nr:MarC family protein [Parabacteroides sp. FAFU027]